MNVFILSRDMAASARMLDDAHLLAQINEATQILMANYNHENYPDAKIGHINHPVTVFYSESITDKNNDKSVRAELVCYLNDLHLEYASRFGKVHQNWFWLCGFENVYKAYPYVYFHNAKTLVNGHMTDDIEEIRKYIMTKPHKRPLKWTNRKKPDWWEV